MVISVVAVLRLRSFYRREPGPGGGFWQLSISDLLVVAFVCGAILSLFKAFWPDHLIKVGAAVTIVTGLMLLAGTLVATRRGIGARQVKYGYALGFTLRTYGLLGNGGTIVIGTIIFFNDWAEFLRFLRTLFVQHVSGSEALLFLPLRTSVVILPIGWIICRTIEKRQGNRGSV
jgi:hypothetical protein